MKMEASWDGSVGVREIYLPTQEMRDGLYIEKRYLVHACPHSRIPPIHIVLDVRLPQVSSAGSIHDIVGLCLHINIRLSHMMAMQTYHFFVIASCNRPPDSQLRRGGCGQKVGCVGNS